MKSNLPLSDKQRAKIRAKAVAEATAVETAILEGWVAGIGAFLKGPGPVGFAERLALNEERHAYRDEILRREAAP